REEFKHLIGDIFLLLVLLGFIAVGGFLIKLLPVKETYREIIEAVHGIGAIIYMVVIVFYSIYKFVTIAMARGERK
ncbi:MAG TPA: hypothetical protein ACFYD5_01060, partial [Candidatus Tripitaka sp. YC43]